MEFLILALIFFGIFFGISTGRAAVEKETPSYEFRETSEPVQKNSVSSFQIPYSGMIVFVDPLNHTIAVKNKRQHIRTFYVHPTALASLTKGSFVQIRLQPGTNKVESIYGI